MTDVAADSNRLLVLRYLEEVVTQRNPAAADELFTADFRIAPHIETPGPDGVRDFVARLRAAFPDLIVALEQSLAEGDLVATHLTLRGTHRGEWRGIAPTGKTVEFREMQVYRIAGGRIAERWFVLDLLGALTQLGAVPSGRARGA